MQKTDCYSPPCLLIPILDKTRELHASLTNVAGLALIRRVVLMAGKAGFNRIRVVVCKDNQAVATALAGTRARYLPRTSRMDETEQPIDQGSVLVLAPDCLPDARFFAMLNERQVKPDAMVLWQGGQAMLLGAACYGELLPVIAKAVTFAQLIDGLNRFGEKSSLKRLNEPVGLSLRHAEDYRKAENSLLSGLVKSTEGWMALHINRKISLAVTRRLMRTAVTPNQMTWVSMILGLTGAACFLSPGHGMQILGALFFLSHSILDGCDGELARLKFMESRFGGMFDFWSDNIVHIAVFAAMGTAWISVSPGSIWPWLCTGLAVGGTVLSASLVYFHTMYAEKKDGPLYTSVSTCEKKSAVVRIADILSRRDFIYLVLALALLGQTRWFLALTALGAPTYALTLIGIMIREQKRTKPCIKHPTT